MRTALQRLQLQGIVEVRRGLGWYVRRTDLAAVEEHLEGRLAARQFSHTDLLEVRIALETTAASLAAVRAGDGELDELAKLNRRYQRAPVDDMQEVIESDEEFHSALIRASHNELLEQMYQTLVPGLQDCKRHAHPSREVHNRAANEHEQVIWFLRLHRRGGREERDDHPPARAVQRRGHRRHPAAGVAEHLRRGVGQPDLGQAALRRS